MSTSEIVLSRNNESLGIFPQMLGTIGMICSPLLWIASLFYARNFEEPNPLQFYASLGGFLYLCGAMASAVGMRRLRVTGTGLGSKILFIVQVIGLVLAMGFDVLEFSAPQLKQSTLFFVTDLAYPFSHLLMIVIGFAVLRAKVWQDWRRFSPFIVGLALPAFLISSVFLGRENSFVIFPLMVTIGFFLLGYAVRSAKKS